MANYPKELTDLVEEYLTDGILTGKERQVLLKKADALGVDTEEFDLYLDAQQQKVDQVADAAVRKAKGKACPYCGAPIPQLADKCPECGQFITAEASEELQQILDNLEIALVDFKSGKDIERSKASVERYSRKAKMYYSNNPKIKAILVEVEQELSAAESAAKKQALINGTIKNRWFWSALPLVFGLMCFAISGIKQSIYPDDELSGMGFMLIGMFSCLGGFVAIVNTYQDKNKQK